MKILYVKEYEILVDDDVFIWAKDLNFWMMGNKKYQQYPAFKRGRQNVSLHSEILRRDGHTARKGFDIDHKNRNKHDCQRINLRIITHAQNLANSGPRTGKYKGVSPHHTGKWRARCNYKPLGNFDHPVAAALAYDRQAIKEWGSFAFLNLSAVYGY